MFKLAYKFLLLFVVVLLTAILFHKFINLPFYWGNAQLTAKSLHLTEQPNQPRAFFIGSSITYHGVIPSIFSEIMDEPAHYAFNLGLDGAQPPQTFYVVEELLKKEEPIDYIFFELNSLDQMAPHIFQTTRGKYYYRLDHLWMSIQYFYHSNYLQRTGLRITHKLGLIAKHGITFLESMLKLGMRKEMIKALMMAVQKTTVKDYGYVPLIANEKTGQVAMDNLNQQLKKAKQNISIAYTEVGKEAEYNRVLHAAIVDLIQRSAAKNIQFICLLPPFERAFDSSSELLALFNALPEANRIDLANPKKYPVFYEVANRWEIGHLNDTGARLYTQYLSIEMAKKTKKIPSSNPTDSIVLALNEQKNFPIEMPAIIPPKAINNGSFPEIPRVSKFSKNGKRSRTKKTTINRIKYQIIGILKDEKTERNALGRIDVYVNGHLISTTEDGQFSFELTDEIIKQDKMQIRFLGADYEPLVQIIDFNNHKKIDLDITLKSLLKDFADVTDALTTIKETDGNNLNALDYLLAAIIENKITAAPKSIETFIPQMELIEGDTFLMRDVLENEINYKKQIQPTVLNNYYLGSQLVTYDEFQRFLRATKRASITDYNWNLAKQPMTSNLNWYQAIAYCNWLSKEHGYEPVYSIDKTTTDQSNQNESDTVKWTITPNWTAQGYRLPTAIEWTFAANALVVADSSRQVQEWCWDWLGEYNATEISPSSATGVLRAIHDGAINIEADTFKNPIRMGMPPYRPEFVGFRLCRRAN